MFDYDQQADPEVTVVSTEKRGEVAVRDITFPSPVDGEAIRAYLVVPPGDGLFPAILYVHWLGEHNSNRDEFLDEAVMMAGEGVISLLVDGMWAAPGWYRNERSLETDYDDAIQQVINLRRGLDVLLAQSDADPERVALVGHDFGAMYGSILAGVDQRPTAYVLVAAASNFNKWMLFGVAPDTEGLDAYKTRMGEFAPTRFIALAAPAPVLFQFANRDHYVPLDDAETYYQAAADPKAMKVYEADHAMEGDDIRQDRIDFLRDKLR
jgi:dienelactone hydrolase